MRRVAWPWFPRCEAPAQAWPHPEETVVTKTSLVVTENIVTLILVMTDAVSFARALGDPTRWRILRLVREDALCVCELADILGMPQSSVSSHVQIIRKAGLLESERCEKWTYFRLSAQAHELVETIARAFDDASTAEARTDGAKAVQRLARREQSCCAGPKVLANPVSHSRTS
jgi:ArsR family transcriptional regulator